MTAVKKIFISYSSIDKEFVNYLSESLNFLNRDKKKNSMNVEVIRDSKFVKAGDLLKPELFHNKINQCDVFLLILSNSSIKSGWVKDEYDYFINTNKNLNESKKKDFIPLLIEDLDKEVENIMGIDIKKYKNADFRNPHSFLKQLDKLLKDIFSEKDDNSKSQYEKDIQNLIYNLSIDPNMEVVRLKNIIKLALEENLIEHFEPLRKDFNMLRKLNQASDRIMTLEAIAEAEKTANDSIWIISTHLNNDIYDKEIQESIKENLRKPIEYKYFVPNTKLIKTRIKEYKNIYKEVIKNEEINNKESKIEESKIEEIINKVINDRFVFLDEYNTIMPFAEVVIYDPLDHMSIWGYVQLNYDDKTTDKNSVFLRIPFRNLFPLVDSLKYLLENEKKQITQTKNK